MLLGSLHRLRYKLKKQNKNYGFACVVAVLSGSLLLFSCNAMKQAGIKDILDPEANLTREDYEKVIPKDTVGQSEKEHEKGKQASASSGSTEPSIPDASEILATPKPPEVGPDKVVSISVTEDVPLKDVLIELGRLADV